MTRARIETSSALTRFFFVFFVFLYDVERLVDVCVCKLTCITDMYIVANGYRMRIRCYIISQNSNIVK